MAILTDREASASGCWAWDDRSGSQCWADLGGLVLYEGCTEGAKILNSWVNGSRCTEQSSSTDEFSVPWWPRIGSHQEVFRCLQAHLVKFSLGGYIKEPEQNVRVCKWSLSYQKIIKNMLNRKNPFQGENPCRKDFLVVDWGRSEVWTLW